MSDFKERLRLELRTEVPFTDEMGERIMLKQPQTKARAIWPIFTGGAVAVIAAALFFLFQTSEDTKYLYNTASMSMDYDAMLELLQENEVNVPLVDGAKNGQQIVEGADAYFHGKTYNFGHLPIIVEEANELKRGDYILFELANGEQYVRQVLGFEGEVYKLAEGNLHINGKQLLLPGYLNSDTYLSDTNQWEVAVYFEFLPNYFKDHEVLEDTLSENELLIAGIDKQYDRIEIISADAVKGKVVAVQKMTPTFYLTGDAADIYEQFKADLDVTRLVGLDPVTMFRFFKQAEFEEEYEVLHALIPSKVSFYNYDIEAIRQMFPPNTHFSKEEMDSIAASAYNGVMDATYELSGETKAYIMYPSRGGYEMTQEMRLNAQGFWEIYWMSLPHN